MEICKNCNNTIEDNKFKQYLEYDLLFADMLLYIILTLLVYLEKLSVIFKNVCFEKYQHFIVETLDKLLPIVKPVFQRKDYVLTIFPLSVIISL